jgi:hypothetical protein
MLTEILKTEVILQCVNVQNGSKLIAEVNYIYKENSKADDILFFEEIIKLWPDLKMQIAYHPDKTAALKGHKIITIYKYGCLQKLLDELYKLDVESLLYHFINGKLFGYNDYEVIKFIEKL